MTTRVLRTVASVLATIGFVLSNVFVRSHAQEHRPPLKVFVVVDSRQDPGVRESVDRVKRLLQTGQAFPLALHKEVSPKDIFVVVHSKKHADLIVRVPAGGHDCAFRPSGEVMVAQGLSCLGVLVTAGQRTYTWLRSEKTDDLDPVAVSIVGEIKDWAFDNYEQLRPK